MNICAELVFKRVFDKCQKPLQHFLLSKGLQFDSMADQVQECFVRLWKNCEKVTEEKALSYLFTMASRIQIDEFRKSKIRLKYKQDFSAKNEDRVDGQFVLEENEFKERLENVLETMKVKSKEVFYMNRFDNMTYKEISIALGISVKAVEKRMSVALKHLLKNKINLKK